MKKPQAIFVSTKPEKSDLLAFFVVVLTRQSPRLGGMGGKMCVSRDFVSKRKTKMIFPQEKKPSRFLGSCHLSTMQ